MCLLSYTSSSSLTSSFLHDFHFILFIYDPSVVRELWHKHIKYTFYGDTDQNWVISDVVFFSFLLELPRTRVSISTVYPVTFFYLFREQILCMHHWETSIHYFMLKYAKLWKILNKKEFFLKLLYTYKKEMCKERPYLCVCVRVCL